MIWNPDTVSEETPSAVVAHVAAEIEALCGPDGVDKSVCLHELAKAVEHYVQEHTAGPCVDSQYLILLASQALSSIGSERAARRLYLLGSGMVRPSEWEVTGDQALWILDLKQLTVRDHASLELLLFNGLRIILESICDVWDETRGRGALGLRHVCSAAAVLMPRSSSSCRAKVAATLRDS